MNILLEEMNSPVNSPKRRQICNEIKLEIIKNESNLKPSELAIKYQLPTSTISTILKNSDKILDHFNQNNIKPNNKRLRSSN